MLTLDDIKDVRAYEKEREEFKKWQEQKNFIQMKK